MIIDQLDPLFSEIADLLGELAGNEGAWRVFDSEDAWPIKDGWMREPGLFTIPGAYGFETPSLYVAMHPTHPDWDSSPVNNAEREQLLQDAVTRVWEEEHTSWSGSALPTVYRSACRNVWEPDPVKMATSAEDLGTLTRFLNRQMNSGAWVSADSDQASDWLGTLKEGWPATSDTPQSFYEFWDDVNDKCGLYLHAAARLASSSARVAATVSDFQTNLLDVTTKARDRIVEALQQWQAWKDSSGAWPTGALRDSSAKEILGHVSYGSAVLALYPPATILATGLSLVTGGLTYIVSDEPVQVMEAAQALTSSEIHRGFMNDLANVESTMTKVLDHLQTDAPNDDSTTGTMSLQSFAAQVVTNRSDWSPLPVNL